MRPEAGGEGGRPSGEAHQHTNQPVDWKRSAASSCLLRLLVVGGVVVQMFSAR